MCRPRSGRIGFAVRTVRISIFGQKRDASLPGHNVDCVATGAHWDGRCDRSAVGTARRAVPRVARLLVALAARDPRLLYRPLRGRGPVCQSEGQTRGISTLTGHFHVDRKHRCSGAIARSAVAEFHGLVLRGRVRAFRSWATVLSRRRSSVADVRKLSNPDGLPPSSTRVRQSTKLR